MLKYPSSMITSRQAGFSLLELSLVILLIGLLSAAGLMMTDSTGGQRCVEETDAEIVAIQEALEAFAVREQRYPKPANPTLGTNDAGYGVELTDGVDPANASFDTLEPSGLFASNGVLIGNLPFVTLGLTNSMDTDCWNHHYTYAVSNALTSRHPTEGFPEPKTSGRIALRAGTLTSSQILSDHGSYVVLSHGPDGVGARTRGASAASAAPCTGNGIDVANCDSNHVFFSVPRVSGETTLNEHFDDLISTHVRTMNCTESTESWLSNCSATVPALNNGATTIVTNNASGYTGTANFSCTNGVLTSSAEACAPSCIADGTSSGGNPAACCNGDSDGNGTCGTQSACGAEPTITAQWTLYGSTSDSYIFPSGKNNMPRNNCPAGRTPTALIDDNDASHSLSEDKSSGGDRAQLCLGTSDTNVQFTSVWATTCPAGTLDTGVYDSDCNDLGEHKLYEEQPRGCRQRWCIGITGAGSTDLELKVQRPYSALCPSGWTWLVGAHNEEWDVNNEDGTINRAVCIKLDYKAASPCVPTGPSAPSTPPSCIADGTSSGGNPAACCNGDSDGDGTCGNTPCTDSAVQSWACGAASDDRTCPGNQKIRLTAHPCSGMWTGYTRYSYTCGPEICGGAPSCIADGTSSGGNPAACCNGDSDGNGTCGTQSACGATEDYGSCTGGTCDVCCNGALGSCPNNHGGDIGLTMGRGCDGSICSPPCLADGSSSGGTPTACCNGDSDGNGTCGTQAACNGYYDPQGGWGPGTLVCPGCDYIGQHKVLSYHNCDIGPCAPPPTPDQPGDAEASIIATLIAAGQNPNDYQICVASGSGSCPSPGCDAWFENNVEIGYAIRK